MRNQSGFTLIELVVVIVVLGILAVVAVPKYVDLKAEAETAAMKGVAGEIGSASAINYAKRTIDSTAGVATYSAAGITCNDAAAALLQGGLPTGYSLNADDTVLGANTCTLSLTGHTGNASVTIIGIE